MNEMVEKVARAINASLGEIEHDQSAGMIDAARAAIEAMREPTEAMKSAEGVHWDYLCHVCGGLKEGWYAMIDEALKEG